MDDELKTQMIESSAELVEAIADQLLSDGIIRDNPILGTAIKFAKLGKTITDRIFLEKIKRFLFALKDVAEDDKQRFYERLRTDEKTRRKTGEVVALILDRLDDLSKPAILAKIFEAYLRDQISIYHFRRLATAIDLAFLDDLWALVAPSQVKPPENDEHMAALVRTGLTQISQSGVAVQSAFGENVTYHPLRITALGQLFLDIMQNESQHEN